MKFITLILLAFLWGCISAYVYDPPISYILAFIGGAFIGIFWPKFYDKLY